MKNNHTKRCESTTCTKSRTSLFSLAAMLMLIVSGSGCQWMKNWQQNIQRSWFPDPVPQVLQPNAQLPEIIAAVNRNVANVHSIDIDHSTMSITGAPVSLAAQIHLQRPRQFRLKGAVNITGSSEIDLGSNNELFWLWIRQSEPKGIYYSRHDEFSSSQMGKILPLRAEQLVEAFGLATLDPQAQHIGPTLAGENRLSIQTNINTADGAQKIVTIIDSRSAWVLEQQLYNAQGNLIASVTNRDFKRDITSGAFLPWHIEMKWPAANSTLSIYVHQLAVNQPASNQNHFQMPTKEGFPAIHLKAISQPPSGQPSTSRPPTSQPLTQRQPLNNQPRDNRTLPTNYSLRPSHTRSNNYQQSSPYTRPRRSSGWHEEPPT